MKRGGCSRRWEAEAIGDGRLDAAARASFERHAATCETCSDELRGLERIADAMQGLPRYGVEAIDRRRARIALLHEANERVMRGRSRRTGVWALAGAALCALALAVAGTRLPSVRRYTEVPIAAPGYEIVDAGHASWTATTLGGTARVALTDGSAAIHVEHLSPHQKFLVDLPDGSLEVRGTRFVVGVAGHRTVRVEVSEGVVALRLLAEPEIVLVAGQEWTLPALTQAPASAATPSPAGAPPSVVASALPARLPSGLERRPRLRPIGSAAARPSPGSERDTTGLTATDAAPATGPSGVPSASSSALPSGVPSGSPLGEPPAIAAEHPTTDRFASCVSAFQSGDYAAADRLFDAFMRDNPLDARSEDAAFLRALAHARMGDAAGAARLAGDYLQRYPQGLRRNEASRLLAGTGTKAR
jgi:FecR protein